MKGDIMVGQKNYFVMSFFIGLLIVILSMGLNAGIFRSAMLFGLASGITICLLSLVELYRIYYVKECPLCNCKIDVHSNKCSNCGYEINKQEK